MPSLVHDEMVKAIHCYTIENYVSSESGGLSESDWIYEFDHSHVGRRPAPISGHIPDFYAHSRRDNLIIIGEAKMGRHIESSESIEQISHFLLHESMQGENIIFILCVALRKIGSARWLLTAYPKNPNMEVLLIDQTGYKHYYASRNR